MGDTTSMFGDNEIDRSTGDGWTAVVTGNRNYYGPATDSDHAEEFIEIQSVMSYQIYYFDSKIECLCYVHLFLVWLF